MSDEKKVVKEHYMKHVITEYEHIPDHDEREDTLEFRNAKHELEKVEHLGCFICGSLKQLQSHHCFERCWANALDFVKVANMLYNHFDFHGHCHRDFKSADELANWFADHYGGEWYEYQIPYDDGSVSEQTYKGLHLADADNALDTIYNQVILCYTDHQVHGEGAHGTSFPTFVAKMAAKQGFKLSIGEKEYQALQKQTKE